jgi:hypothetical protein
MAATNVTANPPAGAPKPFPFSLSTIDLRRLYRAHVEPQHSRGVEVTAFVEAASREAAVRKISHAITALEFGSTPESVAERIYNCNSAAELIDDGLGEDIEARLFETGWGGGKPICFVEHPLFLIEDAAALIRAWAQISQVVRP